MTYFFGSDVKISIRRRKSKEIFMLKNLYHDYLKNIKQKKPLYYFSKAVFKVYRNFILFCDHGYPCDHGYLCDLFRPGYPCRLCGFPKVVFPVQQSLRVLEAVPF